MTNNKEAIKKAKEEARNQIHRLKKAGLLKQIIEDDGYEYIPKNIEKYEKIYENFFFHTLDIYILGSNKIHDSREMAFEAWRKECTLSENQARSYFYSLDSVAAYS